MEHLKKRMRWWIVGSLLLGSCWLKWRRFFHGMFPVFFFGGDIEHPYYEQAKNKLLLGGGFKQFSKNVHPLWKNQLGVIQPPTNWNLVLNFNWIIYVDTLLGTNISPMFEDDFPFPKVGYVLSWRVLFLGGWNLMFTTKRMLMLSKRFHEIFTCWILLTTSLRSEVKNHKMTHM